MFMDLRKPGVPAELRADVCIIGAGPAGIVLALAFARTRHSVLMVESGGFEFDPDIQQLYSGDVVGREYGALDVVRLRYFGGTTNHWGGMCAPLQEIDFEKRDWVPLSGWPIRRSDMDPYYRQAHKILNLDKYDYDIRTWSPKSQELYPLSREKFVQSLWQFVKQPTGFGERHRKAIRESGNIRALLHANATGIRLEPSGKRVRSIELASLAGGRTKVVARNYVIACGGLENARLLLASTDVQAQGVGNGHDMVGRCFMDHPELLFPKAGLLKGDPDWALYQRARHSVGENKLPHVRLAPQVQRDRKLLNTSLQIAAHVVPDPDAGYLALRRLREGDYEWSELLPTIGDVVTDPVDVARGAYAAVSGQQYVPPQDDDTVLELHSRTEQAPNPDSRVTLIAERDALGMQRIALDWRLSEIDKITVRTMMEMFAAELGRVGLGRMRLDDWLVADDKTWSEDLGWGYHHMGTTRMSDDPRTGVVDANCQVHGIDGLHIAGSSVFPTCGYVNPTLSIVALAVRLGDHLKRRLG